MFGTGLRSQFLNALGSGEWRSMVSILKSGLRRYLVVDAEEFGRCRSWSSASFVRTTLRERVVRSGNAQMISATSCIPRTPNELNSSTSTPPKLDRMCCDVSVEHEFQSRSCNAKDLTLWRYVVTRGKICRTAADWARRFSLTGAPSTGLGATARCRTCGAILFEGLLSNSSKERTLFTLRVTLENKWYLVEGSHVLCVRPHAAKDDLSLWRWSMITSVTSGHR